jgi:molecular chaperone DnaK
MLVQVSDAIRVIGIDLGTTNSTVCEIILEPGQDRPSPPRCLNIDQPTTQGRYTHVLVPSIVALYGEEVWVGEGAKRLRALPGSGVKEYQSWFAETKNDIGIQRTYHRAPAGFRSARAVASEILKFLYQAAVGERDIPISKVVVTVPASFQAAQRQDTVAAAQRAGIPLADGQLLDEPIAAFLAYVESAPENAEFLPAAEETRNLVVFDFGGGTCDVAVLRLGRHLNLRLTFTPITVSRYHRLGGGDIDRAIIHEVLIPQLLAQNGLDEFALDFEEKRRRIQPALLGIAEALKQKLSIEIARQKKLGRWDKVDRSALVQTQPGSYPVELQDRTLTLQSPKLSALELEQVLAPFFDRDLLLPREDEYRVSCSMFAPLHDALARGLLERSDIDLCLLAGGSSLIPQIAEELGEYFPKARILTFSGRDDTQTAVAKGAALHALSLAVSGAGMFRAVCHEDVCFQTSRGPVVLVPRGTELPYPREGFERRSDFQTPHAVSAGSEGQIRVQIVGEERSLFEGVWKIKGPVKKSSPLWLDFRFGENQVLDLRMGKEGDEGAFEVTVENPLTHVVNPHAIKACVEELEEAIRTRKIARENMPLKLEQLADLCRKLRQYEKALDYYRKALKLWPEPHAYLLNRMAFCARDLGDRQRAERFFGEANRVEPWSGTWFNWALAKEQWGDPAEALRLVEKAIAMADDPPYSVLKARLLQKGGEIEAGVQLAAAALKRFPPLSIQDEYQIDWFQIGARIAGHEEFRREAALVARRRTFQPERSTPAGELPDLQRTSEEDRQ